MAGGFDPTSLIRNEMLSKGGDTHRTYHSLQPPRPSITATKLELAIRCSSLKDKDLFSKSDPYCVVSTRKNEKDDWTEVGRTEVLSNTLDPAWSDKINLDYIFEERLFVNFEVYDHDGGSGKGEKREKLGEKKTTVGVLARSPCKQFVSVLELNKKEKSKGKIFVQVEEVGGSNDLVQLQFAAEKLDKMDTFGKSDPFYVLSKSSPSGNNVVVHRSEVIKNNLNPTWKPVNLTLRQICGGDLNRPLKIEIYDWDKDGGHDLIGIVKTTLEGLKCAKVEQITFPVVNPKKESKKNYKNSGTLWLNSLNIIERHSFHDYLQGGLSMNFSVAVDFTASNGDPTDHRSLHYRKNPGDENQYTQAIRAVGDVISDYDDDRKFPALGFGAKLPPAFKDANHGFFLHFDRDHPYCDGVDGVLQAYDFAQKRVQQYGPTYFTPTIKQLANIADKHSDGRLYFVLLIITDGIITDLEETKKAIIDSSGLPMSIIIIGVGRENFAPMDVLDSDNGLLRSGGSVASRDIVQFVEMNKFINADGKYNKQRLAQHVLSEVPNQVVEWMTMRGIKPIKS